MESIAVQKQKQRQEAEMLEQLKDWTFSMVRLHVCLKAASHDRDYIQQNLRFFKSKKIAKNVLDAFHKIDYIVTMLDKIYEKEVPAKEAEDASEYTYIIDEFIEKELKGKINSELVRIGKGFYGE